MSKQRFRSDDEYMTPTYAWSDLCKYLDISNYTLWEPFYGSGKSTNVLRHFEYTVISNQSYDFFKDAPPTNFASYLLITNPPFSKKKEVLEKICLEWKLKTFIILLPVGTIFTKYFNSIVHQSSLSYHICIPPARIQFVKDGRKTRTNSFDTCWLVCGIDLPKTNVSGLHFLNAIGNRDA